MGSHLAAAALPPQVDLRATLGPAKDQGPRGTCVAFAVTSAHELARASQQGSDARVTPPEDLSEEMLNWGCKETDGDRASGTSFTSAAAALRRRGQPVEHLWPYDPSRDEGAASYRPPGGALDPAACHTATLRRVGVRIDDLRRYLATGHAIALGIPLCAGFYAPRAGHVGMPAPQDVIWEGHAVVVVGYADRPQPGGGEFTIRNSWGSGWGDGGYGYLPYDYVEQYGVEAWIVDVGHPAAATT